MKLRVISRIFVLFAILAMVMTPTLSFAADSTFLNNNAVLNKNLQKGSGGGVPIGTVITWPVGSNPEDAENWLECNGQAISQAVYPELFAVVGGRMPDYQGMFLRGYGAQSHVQNNGSTVGVTPTVHQSGELGQVQGDASRNVSGTVFGGQRYASTWSGPFSGANRFYPRGGSIQRQTQDLQKVQ